MGLLHDGEWEPAATREQYDHDTFDARVGPDARYPAEAGRYHLYVSRACSWAHRVTLTRRLAGLTDAISMDVVDPVRRDRGWEFSPATDGCTPESVYGFDTLAEVYQWADPTYTGRVTVPVLFDHLWDYARDVYQTDGVAPTCDMHHVKAHYYRSHGDINPTGFVPVGPDADWTAPHDRAALTDHQSAGACRR